MQHLETVLTRRLQHDTGSKQAAEGLLLLLLPVFTGEVKFPAPLQAVLRGHQAALLDAAGRHLMLRPESADTCQ